MPVPPPPTTTKKKSAIVFDTIEQVTAEEIRELESIELGKGIKFEGDFERIRQKVSAFNTKSEKNFYVRASNGKVYVIRDDKKGKRKKK